MTKFTSIVLLASAFVMLSLLRVDAQSTDLTYQGQLQNASAAANGIFDFEFLLFDSGGSQIGPTLTRTGVLVTNGIFSVNLDFGSSFPGATRFLEIRVRQSGGGSFTTLSPRQSISSSPYAVRSLDSQNAAFAQNATNAVNATNLLGPLAGDVTGTQASTTVARLRGTNVAVNLPTNGQVLKFNSGANQWQPSADDTGSSGGGGTITGVTVGTGLTGGGTTGTVTVGIANGGVGTAQLADASISTLKLADLSVGNAKIFDGAVTDAKISSGQVVKSINTLRDNVTLAAGSNVTITPAGNTLTIASNGGTVNAILNQTNQQTANFNITGNGTAGGTLSGAIVDAATQYNLQGNRILSTLGFNNLFAGVLAGSSNTTGQSNSFFGESAGRFNTSGLFNSFFGALAGTNTTGSSNSFFGAGAGQSNTTGASDVFVGRTAGSSNTTGLDNSFFGVNAGDTNISGFNNTALGNNADFANGGLINATAIGADALVAANDSVVIGSISGVNGAGATASVGIGTTTPSARLSLVATGNGARVLHLGTERAWVFKQFGTGAETALELTADSPNNNNKNFLINTEGFVGIGTTAPTATLSVNGFANKPGGGSWGTFSDERLKNINGLFTPGINELMQLQPIRYGYKPDNPLGIRSDGEHIGFSAQSVQKIIPEAVTETDKGYLVINNDPILWTVLNAVKEKQQQIEILKAEIAQLKRASVGADRKYPGGSLPVKNKR